MLSNAPISGLPQDGGGGGGGANPRELESVKRTWVENLISWTSPGWEIWPSRHLGKWRTREWVIRSPPSLKIPNSHLDQFTTFWCVHFFVKDDIMKLAFKFLKFYNKKYFVPKHWEVILALSLILKIWFLITRFNQMLPCHKFLMKDQKMI